MLRQKTYKYFPIKETNFIIFETDNRYVSISGGGKNQMNQIYSQKKGAGCEISIICPDPYF